MALDEPKENDQVFEVDGFTYVADKDFMQMAQPVKVDFIEYGFKLTSSLDLGAAGCSSCGSGSCG